MIAKAFVIALQLLTFLWDPTANQVPDKPDTNKYWQPATNLAINAGEQING